MRVIELAGIGPGPWAAMLLADMGADVLRIDRPGPRSDVIPPEYDVTRRGRRSVVVDLRRPEGSELVLDLVESAEVLIEGNRPGVTERLGVGPEACFERNPRLVYGRMTGWGQTGPLAHTAGHDLTYIAITGAVHAIGRKGEKPGVPINLVGDFGGGGAFLVIGVLAAVMQARQSGQGQVVDASIVDGTLALSAAYFGMLAAGLWRDERGVNLVDSGRPWYEVYETSDNKHIAVGALESEFFDVMAAETGLIRDSQSRVDEDEWPAMEGEMQQIFGAQTREHWQQKLELTDACVAPVLGFTEAAQHPHLVARQSFLEIDGIVQPAPAPRFSRTPAAVQRPPARPGEHSRVGLRDWSITSERIEELVAQGVVFDHPPVNEDNG
jgi:alpha-methylacyl-CoA racemase